MKQLFVLLLTIAGLLLGILSCSFMSRGGSEPKSDSRLEEQAVENILAASDTFLLPQIPVTLVDPFERAVYLVMHYWDRFDFTNRGLIDRPEITEQAFVDYIDILKHMPKENADESLAYTLEKASVDTAMYIHFGAMFEKYLYDFNSPFRNEEMYLPVYRAARKILPDTRRTKIVSPLSKGDGPEKPGGGNQAANFSYTLPSGKSYKLHELTSEYTLLIFSNPGCNTCEAIIERIERSERR